PSAQYNYPLMGDSLPAGTFVANLPATGVTVLQGERISHLLDDALREADLLHYGIYDLSLGASSLTAPNSEPYLQSREAVLGSALNCRFVVIFPFLNDLYIADDSDDGIATYGEAMQDLVTLIREGSPDSQIIVMDYYVTSLQGAGNMTYGEDVSALHVTFMNEAHGILCDTDAQVTCLATNTLLLPITEYVVGSISQADYGEAAYVVVNPNDQAMIDAFWASTPNNPILGDGLHFNPAGQARIVEALMTRFTELDPVQFAPFLQ
ncbi:MAG: hypothetical protein AAFV93_13935, partial [Chloroflexota bacterium]